MVQSSGSEKGASACGVITETNALLTPSETLVAHFSGVTVYIHSSLGEPTTPSSLARTEKDSMTSTTLS